MTTLAYARKIVEECNGDVFAAERLAFDTWNGFNPLADLATWTRWAAIFAWVNRFADRLR